MNLAAWAERNGVSRVTACRWFLAGLLPVPARKVGRLVLVDEPSGNSDPRLRLYGKRSAASRAKRAVESATVISAA